MVSELLMENDTLSPEVLAMLKSAQERLAGAQMGYNGLVAQIMQFYKLSPTDEIDLETGSITRKATT